MPTLTQLYEELEAKAITAIVRIAGQDVLNGSVAPGTAIAGQFAFGTAATASVQLTNPIPDFIRQFTAGSRPPVQIFLGFNGLTTVQFTGVVMDIGEGERTTIISCVGEGRRLEIPFEVAALIVLNSTDSNDAVAALMADAGVPNYAADLPEWIIGTATPLTIQYATYGEAVNKIAQPYGSPWYELPDGQIRVELKDPLPAPAPFRQYFSGRIRDLTEEQRAQLLTGGLPIADIQPDGITNPNAYPRLLPGLERHDFPRNVRNVVTIQGAVLEETDENGQRTPTQIEAEAEADSPWIPTPPGRMAVTIPNELIDTAEVAADMAARYVDLYNRLETILSCSVVGDPEIFLGATVQVEDDYSNTHGRWFVFGYTFNVSVNNYITTLDLRGGGPAAGTSPKVRPFACFTWATTGKTDQVIPVGIGPGGRGVIVTFDGRCSRDPDGNVASYAWSDTEGNVGTGPVVAFAYDPATVTDVDVTLVVTDNDGLTGTITRTIHVEAEDAEGQALQAAYIFSAAEEYMMGSADGGLTWNDIDKATAGVTGDFVACSAQFGDQPNTVHALFMTDLGELVLTVNQCVTSFKPHTSNGVVHGSLGPGEWHIVPFVSPSKSSWLLFNDAGAAFCLFYALTKSGSTQLPVSINGWTIMSLPGLHGNFLTREARGYPPLSSWPATSAAARAAI